MNPADALHILRQAQRIAIVRTDRLGDMVLTLPLALALKEQLPSSSIEIITRSYTAPLVENIPVLDAVHYTDKKSLKEIFHDTFFDAVFFPRMRSEECYAAWRSGSRLRVGSAYRWYSWMLNVPIRQHRKTAERHEAEYNVGMMEAILGSKISPKLVKPVVGDALRREVRNLLQTQGIGAEERYIIIHPGSGGSARDWMPERFGQAARRIAQEQGVRVLITGIESEREKCTIALAHCPDAINLCGSLELPLVIALAEQASLLIANSTGVLHIAAALEIPVVGLYPNTAALSARRWGPYSVQSRVLSPPYPIDSVRADDMSAIEVEDVVGTALSLLR